jgi:hypothetical protein
MTEDTFIHSDQGTHVLTLPFKKSKLQGAGGLRNFCPDEETAG